MNSHVFFSTQGGGGGDAQTDFRSLVKLVLTRPERHELRELTEFKRSDNLSAEGRTRLRKLKEIVSAAAAAQEQLKLNKGNSHPQPRGRSRTSNDVNGGRASPSDDDEIADFKARAQRMVAPPSSRPSLAAAGTPRNSMVAGPAMLLGPAEQAALATCVGRRVRKDFGSHGVFEGLVVGAKVIAGLDMLYFKIRCA